MTIDVSILATFLRDVLAKIDPQPGPPSDGSQGFMHRRDHIRAVADLNDRIAEWQKKQAQSNELYVQAQALAAARLDDMHIAQGQLAQEQADHKSTKRALAAARRKITLLTKNTNKP